ncbi:MAG: AAA domain-containing protein, partial [Bacteroidota bacterium]
MQLSPQLLKGLQNRLKIGNRRGAHLNALPGRSRYKLDLHRLEALAPESSQQFLEDLLRKADFQFSLQINQRSKDFLQRPPEQQQQLLQLQRSLENLAYQTEAVELEKGIQSLGLGFPLLVRRNWKDGRLILAPLFIWTLRIRQSGDFTSWRLQRREDDPILFNEVLLNHLRADGGFSLQGMPEEMTEKGYLSEEDVLKLSEELLNDINQHTEAAHVDLLRMKLTELHPIRPKEEYETILQDHPESAYIHRGALLSIFELQKQSIISDFDDLLAMDDLELPAALTEPPSFQSISSVPTDPSQQKVLHALEAGHNLLIQGPPGTGKSQILTATLVNALENGRHCLVVCEKRTALEVLHQALVERGLGEHCVLIKDSSKDRSTVVNSVRDRLDQYQNKRHRSTHSRQGLEYILRACRRHIATINAQHQRVGERQLMGHNWTEAVGMLLRELAGEEEPPRLQFDPAWFRFKDAEWDRLRQMAREGQALYKDFGSRPDMDFYQRYKFQGEQPFLVERQLTEAFDNYRQQLEDIRLDMAQYKTEYYRLRREAFRREEQKIKGCIHNIRQIYDQHQYDPDFLEENHKSDWLFRLAVLFSAQRKASLRSQQEVRQLFGKLQQLIGRQQGLSALSGGRDLRTAYDELEEWQKEFSSWSNDWDDLIRKKLEEMDVHNIAPSF